MAGTTANYSWPYPESSDFVADGATAIENLADAADASLKTVADNRGEVWIDGFSGSFTSGGIRLTDVFSVTYVAYRIVASMFCSTTGGASMSLQLVDSGGTPASGGSDYKYSYRYHDMTGNTSGDVIDTAHSYVRVGLADDGWGHTDIICVNPQVAATTSFTFSNACTGTTYDYVTTGGGLHLLSSQYPSFQIVPGGKSGTARVDVYGLRKL